MTIRKFARIDDGLVAELLTTDGDITAMFSPALIWVDVSNGPAVAEGWRYDGTNFLPPAPVPAAPTGPTIVDLQAQIAALAAELAALSTVAKT